MKLLQEISGPRTKEFENIHGSTSCRGRASGPVTGLQHVSSRVAYGPYYFRRAAATTDPIMRLKLVVTGAVAGWHRSRLRRR